MPAIVSINMGTANTVSIVTKNKSFSLTRTQVSNYLQAHPTATLSDVESFLVNTYLSQDATDDIYIHVYTTNPLDIGILVVNTGTTIDPNWYVRKGS